MRYAPALYYHPDATEEAGRALVGRRAAGESFLKAALSHFQGEVATAVIGQPDHGPLFRARAEALAPGRPLKTYLAQGQPKLEEPGSVFLPGPGLSALSWVRHRVGPRSASLIGVTHTVATRRVAQGFRDLLVDPIEAWDAVICTSRAVHSVVSSQLELEAEHFRTRFGARRIPVPRLPVIPLGVHARNFQRSGAARARLRAEHGTPAEAVVVLAMGRRSSNEKAQPSPLLSVLQSLTAEARIEFWHAGWAATRAEQALHEAAAREIAPDLRTVWLDGRDARLRAQVWSAADIFTLPVDNIQETFGLAPVEAMAAGLPVVVPDWNGFRDTVVPDAGILVPTALPAPGAGGYHAARFADGRDPYANHLAAVQNETAIDLPAYRAALAALIGDRARRKAMGLAGIKHVRSALDWAAVIPRYAALAEELAEIRRTAPITAPKEGESPYDPDVYHLYRAYPSHRLGADTLVLPEAPRDLAGLEALMPHAGIRLYRRLPTSPARLVAVQDAVGAGARFAALVAALGWPRGAVEAAVLFLAKYGVLRLEGLERADW